MNVNVAATSGVAEPVPDRVRSGTQRRVRVFLHNPFATGGVIAIAILLVLALVPSVFAPYDPNAQSLANRLAPPSGDHWLGTDGLGRDQLSRLIYGARTSMLAGVEAVGLALVVGVPLGMTAAYFKGSFEAVVDRVNDALMSVPALLLAITVVAVLGPGLGNAMLAVGITFVPRFYRIARAAATDLREETFIEASRALGCSSARVLGRHVLPNILSPVIVQAAVSFGTVVLAEASLSFLGLGVRPPTASWGQMLQAASTALYEAPHLVFAPGILLVITVLSFQFAGEGLREALGAGRRDDTESAA